MSKTTNTLHDTYLALRCFAEAAFGLLFVSKKFQAFSENENLYAPNLHAPKPCPQFISHLPR